MNKLDKYCKCGCGRIVRHPFAKYIRCHLAHPQIQSVNDQLNAICAFCGKDIKVHRWRLERFGEHNVFCSRLHQKAQQSRKALRTFSCEYCETTFQIQGSRKQGKHIFCSLSCAAKFNQPNPSKPKISVQCDWCHREYEIYPSKHKINRHFYCSLACRAKYIMGTNNPAFRSGWGRKREYANNWKSQRQATIKRDNGCCQVCHKIPKKQRYLHVHHIVPAYIFNGDWVSANNLTNLISLCGTCHKKAERNLIAFQPKIC